MNPRTALRFVFRHPALLVMPLLLAPLAATAAHLPGPGGASTWTIYGFANGHVLYGILTSAKAMVASGNFRNFLEFMAMLGMVGTIIVVGFGGGRPRAIAGVFIAATFFLTVGLGTTTNVDIEDDVTGTTYVVKDVPIIAALPEAIVSTIGHELARVLDTFYSTPDDLKLTGSGAFNIASALVQASTQVQITNPDLRATIAAFAQNCIVPSLVGGHINAGELTTSDQLWGSGGTLQKVNPAPLTPVYTDTQPGGVILPCGLGGVNTYTTPTPAATNGSPALSSQDAYDYISDYIAAGAPQWLAQGSGAWAGTSAYSWLSSTLTSAQSYLFGGSLTQSTGETIQQAAAINALGPALNAAAVASGQSQMVTALAVAQGEKSQVSSWATAVSLFRDLSGYIYSVLQAFLIAMTPILIAAAFMPGTGWMMVKSYLHITIWLALWLPVLSIINYIVTLYAQGEMSGVLGGSGGYSMASMTAVNQMTSHLVLAAGFLATSTPLITWALVKGSFAFTEFLTSGVGTRMAGLAGSIAATGNISLDNQSFDNTSMHQQMMASTLAAGTHAAQIAGTDGRSQTTLDVGGDVIGHSIGGANRTSLTAQQSASVAHLQARSRSASARAGTELGSATTQASQAQRVLADAYGHNQQAGTSVSAATMHNLRDATLQANKAAHDAGLESDATATKNKDIALSGNASAAQLGSMLGGLAGRLRKGAAAAGRGGRPPFDVRGKTDLQVGDRLNTKSSSGDKASDSVSSDHGANTERAARLSHEASEAYSALSNATRNISKTASERYQDAANLTRSASTDFTTSTRAQQSASRIESTVANRGSGSVGGAEDVAGAAFTVAPTLPDDGGVSRQTAALDEDVNGHVGKTPEVGNSGATTAAAETAAQQAAAHAGEARTTVNKDTSNFDAAYNERVGKNTEGEKGARRAANSAAKQTADDSETRLRSQDYEQRFRAGETNKNAESHTKATAAATNSINPVNTKGPKDGANLGPQVGVYAAGALAAAAAGGVGAYAGAKAAAKTAEAAAEGAAETGGEGVAKAAGDAAGTAARGTAGTAAEGAAETVAGRAVPAAPTIDPIISDAAGTALRIGGSVMTGALLFAQPSALGDGTMRGHEGAALWGQEHRIDLAADSANREDRDQMFSK